MDFLQEQLVDPLSNVLNVLIYLLIGVGIYFTAHTRFIQIRYFRRTRPFRGSGKEEMIKRAMMGVSAAAVIALAPLCIPPAQAHADDPCVSITDPAAHQACIDGFLRDNPVNRSHRDNPMNRYHLGNCEGASPLDGQMGQVCG